MISIIIPHFNDFNKLKECVLSILKNKKLPNNYEIIIVDDNSNFFDLKNFKNFIKKKKLKKIKILENNKNLGPASSRNKGAKIAKYENLLFLDSDTKAKIDTLEVFLKMINKYPIIVGIYDQEPIMCNLGAQFRSSFEYFFLTRGDKERTFYCFHAGIAGIKKKIFIDSGGFDEKIKYGMDYENEEFGRRLSLDHRIVLVTNLRVKHFYPSFKKILIKTFTRTMNWIFFIINSPKNYQKFENHGYTNMRMAISIFNNFFLFLNTIVLIFYFNKYLFILYLFQWIYHFIFYLPFYSFLRQKFKYSFPIHIFLNLIYSYTILFGAIAGIVKILFLKHSMKII